MSVLDILLQKNLLNKDSLREVHRQISEGSTMEQALVSQGVKPEDIMAARGEFLNIPVRSVAEGSVPFDVLDYIPQ